MPTNTRPQVEWTSEQLDQVDDVLIRLRAEIECVRTCLQFLIHYTEGAELMVCDELPGARYLLKSAMREAQATVEGWWDQMRASALTGPEPPEPPERVKRETKAAKAAETVKEKGFRGPRRVIEPAASVLDQVKDGELRDLRDMVEFTHNLEGLFRIFGSDFVATVTLDPSDVQKFYGSNSLFREAIDRDMCDLAAVDLIDLPRALSGM